jgi:shikimate kinase
MKIILTGYMGSGKSTVAQKLSEQLGIPALDLDHVIEARLGMPVAAIFGKKGELFFRKAEHEALKELLLKDESFILATGGGTPCYYNNHELLQAADVQTVYLLTPVPDLLARLEAEPGTRPMLAGLSAEDKAEFVAKHLFDRSFYYNQAHHVVPTGGRSPADVVSGIREKLSI